MVASPPRQKGSFRVRCPAKHDVYILNPRGGEKCQSRHYHVRKGPNPTIKKHLLYNSTLQSTPAYSKVSVAIFKGSG